MFGHVEQMAGHGAADMSPTLYINHQRTHKPTPPHQPTPDNESCQRDKIQNTCVTPGEGTAEPPGQCRSRKQARPAIREAKRNAGYVKCYLNIA